MSYTTRKQYIKNIEEFKEIINPEQVNGSNIYKWTKNNEKYGYFLEQLKKYKKYNYKAIEQLSEFKEIVINIKDIKENSNNWTNNDKFSKMADKMDTFGLYKVNDFINMFMKKLHRKYNSYEEIQIDSVKEYMEDILGTLFNENIEFFMRTIRNTSAKKHNEGDYDNYDDDLTLIDLHKAAKEENYSWGKTFLKELYIIKGIKSFFISFISEVMCKELIIGANKNKYKSVRFIEDDEIDGEQMDMDQFDGILEIVNKSGTKYRRGYSFKYGNYNYLYGIDSNYDKYKIKKINHVNGMINNSKKYDVSWSAIVSLSLWNDRLTIFRGSVPTKKWFEESENN